jgi:hypothetical protein
MIRHDIDHPTVKRTLDDELICMIEKMSLTSTPAQIFRELKAKEGPDRLLSLTIKQVCYFFWYNSLDFLHLVKNKWA